MCAKIINLYLVNSLFLFLSLAAFSQQVDIRIRFTNENLVPPNHLEARCMRIQPGVCCIAPTIPTGALDVGFRWWSDVNFRHLTALDLAAVWGPRFRFPVADPVLGCSGRTLVSRMGPMRWHWLATPVLGVMPSILGPADHRATGASYITLPQSLPPTPIDISAFDIQGILGLVWGGGKWFQSRNAERLLAGRRSLTPRAIRSPQRGTVFARSPIRGVYPTLIEINGTEYSDGGTGSLNYRDEAGKTLNLTDWFIRQ